MTETKKKLFTQYAPIFLEMGFDKKESLYQFREPFEGGFRTFIVSVSVYDTESVVELHLGVRHDAIESFVGKFIGGLTGFKPDMMTIVTSMARVRGEVFRRYVIQNGNDLSDSYSEIEDFVRHIGYQKLHDWSDIRELNKTYNLDPFDLSLVYNAYNKAIRGITLARFSNNPNYEELKKKYRYFIAYKKYPPGYLTAFDQLTKFLDVYHPN
jgi:hypothetical protein